MSELRLDTYTMPAARLGPENPLPNLLGLRNASTATEEEEDAGHAGHAGKAEVAYPDQGQESNSLPYRLQDDYDRVRRPRAFKTAVLENQILRATFLLEMGGRLWSLFHKPSGRELLHVNPVFQPANLGLRNAWFSGGVEWNVGICAHSPYTCSPIFAARAMADDGKTPVLRLYEFERVRRIVYQLDFWLPDGSSFMILRGRVRNTNAHAIPMWWWSNIAVDEAKGVRVIAPADTAIRHDYNGKLVIQNLPLLEGVDITYATNRPGACDLYPQIPQERRPFICALDSGGRGLFHATTDRLRGRKVWVWGSSAGTRHWQEFLAAPGHAYIEIQAGSGNTQAQYLAMPGGAQWTWLESYGLLEADPAVVHGPWPEASATVEKKIDGIVSRQWMEQELPRTAGQADRAPQEILQRGSGWGALERRRRAASGEGPLAPAGLVFDDASLGPDQQPWLELLEKGVFPPRDPDQDPGQFMVQPQWHKMLEDSIQGGRSNHWLAWLHLGVMRFRVPDHAGAIAAWEKSLASQRSGWSLRNLAVMARLRGKADQCADLYAQALRLLPRVQALAIECCEAQLNAGRYSQVLELQAMLPAEVRGNWRLQMLAARASLELGDLPAVERFLNSDIQPTSVREQEVSLSDMWFSLHEKRLAAQQGGQVDEALRKRVRREFPPPQRLDFRLRVNAE